MTEQIDSKQLQTVWQSALKSVQGRMSEHNYDMWIRPLRFVDQQGNQVTVVAPNRYIKEWFEDNYLHSVRREITKHTQSEIAIQVRVDEPPSRTDEPLSRPETHEPAVIERPNLNDRYRFDNFIVGPSNQFAQAAANLVADQPGNKYNPLFIYGGTGLGKTHLIQAIGHAILDRNPSWNVVYITSERFMNEYINCIRLGKMDEYRERYRNHCDVLLIDDIQFLAGKDRTQEEFFHTFNTLHELKRQIVITSDKFPNQMPELEERLKSRFQWGLIVDILAPELETRVAILMKKAELDEIPLPDDVAHFLANRIQSNVRELEGALIRLAAFASLQGCAITVEFAEKILSNMLSRGVGRLTIDRIQREVASYFNIRQKDMKSARRPRSISFPRQIAMHLCRKLTSSSLSEIGRQFGGKDHTTVLNADRKMRRLTDEDDSTRSTVEALERLLTG